MVPRVVAGGYAMTLTGPATMTVGSYIIPSGSSGGTMDGHPYTFSGDTLTSSYAGEEGSLV